MTKNPWEINIILNEGRQFAMSLMQRVTGVPTPSECPNHGIRLWWLL